MSRQTKTIVRGLEKCHRLDAIGALIGAIAGVGWGFDGYFVVQSNAGPIRCAIVGAAFLAIGSLLWRLTTGLNSIDRIAQPRHKPMSVAGRS